jgi:hypothetical protein
VEKKDHKNIQEWLDRGGLFRECSDDLRAVEPDVPRMKCYKALFLNIPRKDVRRKVKNFSWKDLSGQTLNVHSSTID